MIKQHLNEVIISGRVSWGIQTDEIQKKAGGIFKKFSFGLATTEKWETPSGEVEKPMFVTCELYENDAREAMNYVGKGTEVTIKGRLDYQTWIDKRTNEERSKHVIKVEQIIYDMSKEIEQNEFERP